MVKQLDRVLDSHLIGGRSVQLLPASKPKRLLNFIFDYVGIIMFMAITFFIIAMMGGEAILHVKDQPMGTWLVRLLGLSAMLIYYTGSEYFFKGKTLGKMLTNTKVVTVDGDIPVFKIILFRSLARFIPFEIFSFFWLKNGGWHDQFSKTIVVEDL